MNRFGHMADDLTSLEMSIENLLHLPHAKSLKAALQRAFVEACKASRAQRLAETKDNSTVSLNDSKPSVHDKKTRRESPARCDSQKSVQERQTNNAAH